jgi:tRNA-Thr(GGU) m(6)t(6)A37 methyltransferase TsaA
MHDERQDPGDGAVAAAPTTFVLGAVGVVRSTLTRREDAPRQGFLGAPEAWIEIHEAYEDALLRVEAGMELVLLTWLHLSERDVLQVHPGSDHDHPLTGVFATRSPVRPNPIGLHPVTVLEVDGRRLRVAPLEAIDGTPVVDVKVQLKPRPDET